MKAILNGCLHLSTLDGWWAEGYDGTNGWALSGDVDHDHGHQDHEHASELYRLLEEEVIPAFYERPDGGPPRAWLERVRASMRTNGWLIEGKTDSQDPNAVDQADAEALYGLLENEVVPAFYDRDTNGIPKRWLEIVRRSLITVTPNFSTRRMLKEYVEHAYAKAVRE
jgi:glucan phosphorylase